MSNELQASLEQLIVQKFVNAHRMSKFQYSSSHSSPKTYPAGLDCTGSWTSDDALILESGGVDQVAVFPALLSSDFQASYFHSVPSTAGAINLYYRKKYLVTSWNILPKAC